MESLGAERVDDGWKVLTLGLCSCPLFYAEGSTAEQRQ